MWHGRTTKTTDDDGVVEGRTNLHVHADEGLSSSHVICGTYKI